MLPHKTAELKILRYVRSAGEPREVSIPDLASIVGTALTSQASAGRSYIVQRLQYLREHGWTHLDKYLKFYGFVDYDEALSRYGLTESDFFYQDGFRVNITPDGTTYFERLNAEEEQEIAIAAFLAQIHDRDIPALVYAHETVKREGLREQLKLEPLTFKDEYEVLKDFRERLRNGKFKPAKAEQRVL